jgi:hypothetical protein
VSAPEASRLAAPLAALPSGTMVEVDGRPCLVRDGGLRPWSFGGYGLAWRLPARTRVRVLTPASIVRSMRAGFAPEVHESAEGSAPSRTGSQRERK